MNPFHRLWAAAPAIKNASEACPIPIHIQPRRFWIAFLLTLLWACSIVSGFRILATYAATAGSSGSVIRKWPKQSQLIRKANGRTLVMAIHPRCACTRASLEELGKVVRGAEALQAYVLVLAPEPEAARWYQTDLYRTASRLPGVQVLVDRNGREAARFGVDTSGHALLYSASGDLEFSGGITGMRGQTGDNPGQSALMSLIREGGAQRRSFPVFGCSLFGSKATL